MPSTSHFQRFSALFAAVALSVGTIGLASQAWASDSSIGSISNIITTTSGRTFFSQNGTRTGRPNCSVADRWVIDNTTPTGQALLATLLTAHATGHQVIIAGTGGCEAWPDTETAYFILIP